MRRQFVTHPSFQFSFTLWFVAGVGVLFLLIGGATLWPLLILANSPELSIAQRGFFTAFSGELIGFLFYLLIFSILIFCWVGLYLSYKFVGPLMRVEAWLEEGLANKSFPPIKLRPGDELIGVVSILSRMAQKKFRRGTP